MDSRLVLKPPPHALNLILPGFITSEIVKATHSHTPKGWEVVKGHVVDGSRSSATPELLQLDIERKVLKLGHSASRKHRWGHASGYTKFTPYQTWESITLNHTPSSHQFLLSDTRHYQVEMTKAWQLPEDLDDVRRPLMNRQYVQVCEARKR